MSAEKNRKTIQEGRAVLGIELGSTRIKAVLVNEENQPIASGSHEWENQYVNQYLDLQRGSDLDRYPGQLSGHGQRCKRKVRSGDHKAGSHRLQRHDARLYALLTKREIFWYLSVHGRNTMTEKASEELTELFAYHIPQRWSIAHLYQAMLNKEEHVKDITFMTTLEGYVHWKLTGEKVLGVGEASGMFPVDMNIKNYDQKRMEQFENLAAPYGYPWKLHEILPKVLLAGEEAGPPYRRKGQNFWIPPENWKQEFLSVLRKEMQEQEWWLLTV